MKLRISIAAGLCAAIAAAPLLAVADAPAYYNPPKLKSRGTSQSPISAGSVVVKVFVKADGSVGSAAIVRAAPQSDAAPALEIAKSSTYYPASRGSKKVAAFYDYTLNFKSGGVAPAGDAYSSFEDQITKNQFKAAADGATAYLQTHPTDARALGDLAIADYFQKDYAGAVAALDKGGTVQPNFKAVPINAYNEYVNAQIDAKEYTTAISAAKRLVTLSPSYNSENSLGFAELNAKDYADSVTDLSKARDDANNVKADPKTIASIDLNLEQAYIGAGNVASAKGLVPEIGQMDSTRSTAAQNVLANYYSEAGATKADAKQYPDAAATYEQAAQDVPSFASTFYTSAAFMYLQQDKPDNVKAKADADKALAADPSNAKANYAAGIALANAGKSADALTYLKKADDLAKSATPQDPKFTAQVETAMAQVNKAK